MLGKEDANLGVLHNYDFVMTKYPRKRKSNSLPHERVFTMDYENLVGNYKYHYLDIIVCIYIVNNVASNRIFQVQPVEFS